MMAKRVFLLNADFCHCSSGFNFTCTSCIISYHSTQTAEIFHILQWFGTFSKLRKITASSCMSACLAACPST